MPDSELASSRRSSDNTFTFKRLLEAKPGQVLAGLLIVVWLLITVVLLVRAFSSESSAAIVVPSDAELIGYCRQVEDFSDGYSDGAALPRYEISISAFAGGVLHTVGQETGTAAFVKQFGGLVSEYYLDGEPVSFGAASEDCAYFANWTR